MINILIFFRFNKLDNKFNKLKIEKYNKFFTFLNSKNIKYNINKKGIIKVLNKEILFIRKNDDIDIIPDNTIFYCGLDISENNFLEKIGKNVKVIGDLTIVDSPNLNEIGDGLNVKRTFELMGKIGLKTLPNDLLVNSLTIEDYLNKDIKIGKNTKIINELIYYNNDLSIIEFDENVQIKTIQIQSNTVKINKFHNINKNKELKLKKFYANEVIINYEDKFDKNEYNFWRTKHNAAHYNYFFYTNEKIFSKLFSEDFDKITEKEINNYIKNNNFTKSNNEIVGIWEYCCSHKLMLFLRENGYSFCDDELKTIKKPFVINMYEKELLKQKNDNFKTNANKINNLKRITQKNIL